MQEIIQIDGFIALYIFMLAGFVGYEIIGRVPAILHTPLMSGSNFIVTERMLEMFKSSKDQKP